MDFAFTEEQEIFRRTVREFAQKKIKPRVREMETRGEIPEEVFRGMADLGLPGITLSKEYGGAEADPITTGIAAEEIGRADISCATAVYLLLAAAWGRVLDKYGREEVKAQILPKVCRGEAFLGIGATEPGAGSDLGSMVSTARREAGGFVLNGEKLYISGVKEASGRMKERGGFVTLIKTTPEKGVRGMSLFYIPLKDQPGLSTTSIEEIGRKGISAGGFIMKDLKLPEANLIGEVDRGFYYAMDGFDYARAIIAVVCAGAAMSALEMGMDYIKQRRVFGQPLAKYEGVQFKLAEDYAKLDAVRLLGYRGLWMLGKTWEGKMFSRGEAAKAVAEAKMLAPVFAFEAINDALQWFGAFGYTTECPVEMGLRGVRSYMWAEGANEIMKIIVARELLGREYLAYR